MLYIGAFTDTWPIGRYSMWVKDFVYYDGVPEHQPFEKNSNGYRKTKDIPTLVDSITRQLPGGCLTYTKVSEKEHRFLLNGGVTLTYHPSTLADEVPRREDITCMFVAGFVPWECGFTFNRVPNLQYIFNACDVASHPADVPAQVRWIWLDEVRQHNNDEFEFDTAVSLLGPGCEYEL